MNQVVLSACLALMLVLTACAPANPVRPTPEPADVVLPTRPVPPTAEPLPFVPATYRDEPNGFELDYPSEWSLDPNTQVGSRGSQAQLFSPSTTAETLAPGGSRLTITLYEWDPQGDLSAYVAQRRTAWSASGFVVRDGSMRQLVDGRPASDFFIEAPAGVLAYFLLTTNGAQYLQLAGEGDLALVETIARTLRPLNYSQ